MVLGILYLIYFLKYHCLCFSLFQVNIQSGVSPINNNDAFLIADEPPKRLSNDGDSENEHQMAQQINDDYLEAKKLNEVHVFNNEAKDDDKQNVNFEQGKQTITA